MASKSICKIDGCDKPARARGWCVYHYNKWRRHGSPTVQLASRPTGARKFLDEVVLVHDGEGCLVWPFCRDRKGYARIRVAGKTGMVHRLVCEATNGPPPTDRHEVAHSCGNGHKGCVCPRHLRWATRAENLADCVIHGTTNRGERCALAKLDRKQVRAIRALSGTCPRSEIAARFGVSYGTVAKIARGERWGWLE